jgi:hypothetical protein
MNISSPKLSSGNLTNMFKKESTSTLTNNQNSQNNQTNNKSKQKIISCVSSSNSNKDLTKRFKKKKV